MTTTLFLSTLSLRRATIIAATTNPDTGISIHALLAESDDVKLQSKTVSPSISIHALLAESDHQVRCAGIQRVISIHALLAESDAPLITPITALIDFYPRSPCGERQFPPARLCHQVYISIHALLAESDLCFVRKNCRFLLISIHALLAESDLCHQVYKQPPAVFLSTLSLRRATAKVHKTVGHFCAYETNFMEIASSC